MNSSFLTAWFGAGQCSASEGFSTGDRLHASSFVPRTLMKVHDGDDVKKVFGFCRGV